jgi:hypothetical protein
LEIVEHPALARDRRAQGGEQAAHPAPPVVQVWGKCQETGARQPICLTPQISGHA